MAFALNLPMGLAASFTVVLAEGFAVELAEGFAVELAVAFAVSLAPFTWRFASPPPTLASILTRTTNKKAMHNSNLQHLSLPIFS